MRCTTVKMEIINAKTAGFCFGVRRAVEMAEKAAGEFGGCVTLGQLIHNNDVVRALEDKGVRTVNTADEVLPGQTVIIRSHGVGMAEYEALRAKGANIVDATCPEVKRIHDMVRDDWQAGRQIIIFGERDHPEVIASAGWCEGAIVLESAEEAEKLVKNRPELAAIPVTVVSQTTAVRERFDFCINILKKLCTNLKIFDTICYTTANRQKEAASLASQCEAVVVIGGRHSANSVKLAEICAPLCDKVFFIENAEALDISQLRGIKTVGVTAGASTPEWIIKEVNKKMSDEIREEVSEIRDEQPEQAVETAAEETAQAVQAQAEAPEAESAEEASFEEMLEKSIKTLHTGEKVTGIVAAVTPTEVSIDLGTKQSGYIPASEITDDPNANVNDIVKVGDSIEAYVMRVNDVEGTVMLSKKRLDSVKAWDDIAQARNERTVVEGKVTEENKGGVVVNLKGIRVFVPASQSGLPKDTPMTELVGKTVRLRITEVNQPRRRVVGSIRAVQFEERRERAEKLWEEIEVGKHYNGVVKSMTSYGAFVDIGGVDGMVHVSEISWDRIRQPADVLSIGQEIDVYVISFDKENKKISLGYKDPNANPWTKFTDTYKVDDVAEVKIVKLMAFGAFAEIIPGVDGLIHISQIANQRIGKPDEVLSEGETVNAKIVNIDEENHKVSLSIRALLSAEAAPVAEEE